MSAHITDGVILKVTDLRETSLLLRIFTEKFGKITCQIKGARGMRASQGGIPQIFSFNEFVVHIHPKRDVHLVSEYDLRRYYSHIRRDFEKITLASYLSELTDSLLEENSPNPDLYGDLLKSLDFIDKDAMDPKLLARIFEIRAMQSSGFLPELDSCDNCRGNLAKGLYYDNASSNFGCPACLGGKGEFLIWPGSIKFINRIRHDEFENLLRIKIGPVIGKNIKDFFSMIMFHEAKHYLKTMSFAHKVKQVL